MNMGSEEVQVIYRSPKETKGKFKHIIIHTVFISVMFEVNNFVWRGYFSRLIGQIFAANLELLALLYVGK